MQKKSIYVAYTGGTIGMQRSENGYIPVSGHLQRQLALMPEFHRPEMPDFTIHEYEPLMDSSDMTPEDWQHIADDIRSHYEEYDGFVILHGTDTMAFTASALSFMLENLGKPVWRRLNPLLNRLLRGLSRPAHRGLLAVLAVPLIVYPTLFGQNGAVSDTAWMFLYEYLLIAYLRRWPDNRLAHLLQHRAAALGLGLGLPLLNTILRAVLETRGLTDGKAFQYMAYYRTALGALPNLLAALALFYLFKRLDLGCVRWVNALAGTTLGVYILHQVPAFRGFLWNGLLQAEAHHGSVGYTLLAILAVFLGCAAVDALRTALVMRPLENTHLFKALCEKGDALAAKITADD